MGNSGHNKRTEAILKEAADPSGRQSPLAMDASTFRTLGHRLVDQVAEFLESVPRRPVTHDESPSADIGLAVNRVYSSEDWSEERRRHL